MDVLSKFRLDGRIAIVTGSGRGIGKAIALALAKVGADITVVARTVEQIEQTAEEIRKLGRRALAIPIDVTVTEQVHRLVEATVNEFGRIDILVNNAGCANPLTPVAKISDDEWDWFIKLNLTSAFLCSRAVTKVMLAQKRGNIINISSGAGIRADPGLAPYAAAKAGLINFTQTLSVELARYYIRVNCIIVSSIESSQGEALRGTSQERVERRGIPLGRIGQPEDVALAAVYLASDASDYVTGACIEVEGGPSTRKGDTEAFVSKFPEL